MAAACMPRASVLDDFKQLATVLLRFLRKLLIGECTHLIAIPQQQILNETAEKPDACTKLRRGVAVGVRHGRYPLLLNWKSASLWIG